ncbi:MAG: riboflavin synthase [Cyanobacteriota bacterium]
MFTGLVRAMGHLSEITGGVAISAGPGLPALQLGDSVAVDGVCLTVRRLRPDGFEADVSPETLRRTTLAAKARRSGAVNLEPALTLSDRLGGHLVSGHVDGSGQLLSVAASAESWLLELAWDDPAYGRFMAVKGSVTVDGVSLTVAAAAGARFQVAVVPHTWSHTTLGLLQPGDAVNLEADLLARYVERLLAHRPGGAGAAPMDSSWLVEHGWSA